MTTPTWFSINPIGSCLHTRETLKIKEMVESLPEERSISFNHFGKKALIKMARSKGFRYSEELSFDDTVIAAFQHLKEMYQGATKAYIFREALRSYADSYNH